MAKPMTGTGTIEEKTIRTRILPVSEVEPQESIEDVFEFLEALGPEEWEEKKITLTLHRLNSEGDRSGVWLETFYKPPFTCPMLREMYGGGTFRVFLKVGAQLRKVQIFKIAGPEKPINAMPVSQSGAAPSGEASGIAQQVIQLLREELRASRGGDASVDAVRSALELNATVFKAGADTLRSTLASAQPVPVNPMEGVMNQFLQAAIAKLLAPTDPVQQIVGTVNALKGAGFFGGGETVKTESVGAALANRAPELIQGVVETAREYRLAAEAAMRTEELRRGAISVGPIRPAEVGRLPNPSLEPVKPNDGPTATVITMEMVESKIVEMFQGERTGEEAALVIDELAPKYLDMVKPYTVEGLIGAMRSRKIFAPILNAPRLPEFIKEFLVYANEPEEPKATEAPKPN